jgi:hypothetical protein
MGVQGGHKVYTRRELNSKVTNRKVEKTTPTEIKLFLYVVGGLESVGHSSAYVACIMYIIFEGCLDSNPESIPVCHQLSLPSL